MTAPNLVMVQSEDHCDMFVCAHDSKGRIRVQRAFRPGEFLVADLSASGAEQVRDVVIDPGRFNTQ